MKTSAARERVLFRTILSLSVLSFFLATGLYPVNAADMVNIGKITPDPSRLWSPGRLAVGNDGTIYVVDSYKNRVQKFDGKGTPLGPIPVSRPSAIAASPNGNVYIGSNDAYAVAIYKRGERTGYLGAGKNEFGSISDIAVDKSTDDIYVVDLKKHVVKIYDASGSAKGMRDGFTAPAAVAVTDTAVVVLDAPAVPCPTTIMVKGEVIPCPECTGPCSGSRISVLDKAGNLMQSITESDAKKDNMVRPVALAADTQGNIYVADALRKNILVYNLQCKFIGELVSAQDDLHGPVSLALSRDNSLYVSSSETRSIVEIGLAGRLNAASTGSLKFQSKQGAGISLGALGY